MNFFSLDSPFQKYGTIVFDLLMLNIFWFFTTFLSFGILFPLASAALFHSVYNVIIKQEGYMMRLYFSVIKEKFLKSLLLSLISFVLYGICFFNIWTVWTGLVDIIYLLPLYFVILFEVCITLLYAYALLGETDMNLKQLIKYGFLLAHKHLLTSILCILIIVATTFILYVTNLVPVIFIMAPVFLLMAYLIHKRVFDKYHLDKLV